MMYVRLVIMGGICIMGDVWRYVQVGIMGMMGLTHVYNVNNIATNAYLPKSVSNVNQIHSSTIHNVTPIAHHKLHTYIITNIAVIA